MCACLPQAPTPGCLHVLLPGAVCPTHPPAGQTYEAARSLAEHLGKSVCVSQDRPGFLTYRYAALPTHAVRLTHHVPCAAWARPRSPPLPVLVVSGRD